MRKDLGLMVCLMILLMDISAGILSIEAERAQNKVNHTKTLMSECRHPSSGAFKIGLAAALLLALAHFAANVLGGCTCLWSKQDFDKASANKILALAFLVFSWILLAVGFSMLIIGALANSGSRKFCGLPRHQIFITGGVFCFIHGLFTMGYYISASAAAREEQRRLAHQTQMQRSQA